MEPTWKTSIWQQFGAAIDMLDNTLLACPEELWGDRAQGQEFWYVTYHCLFWLDLYLTGKVEGFAPPPRSRWRSSTPQGYCQTGSTPRTSCTALYSEFV